MSEETSVITLYDIPSNLPRKAWSPNTQKARYTLNIKGITHKTVWVEYPDIHTVYKKHNIQATAFRPDGSPYYSVPIIHDPNTGKTIADSLAIAVYLDETYPDTPRLVPEGTHMLQDTFVQFFRGTLSEDYADLLYGRTVVQLSQASAEWYKVKKDTRHQEWHDKYGSFRTLESEEAGFKAFQKDLDKVDKWYKGGDKFVSGSEKLIFADLMIAGFVGWVRTTWGEDSAEWQDIMAWHDGRWKALFEKLKPFEQVL